MNRADTSSRFRTIAYFLGFLFLFDVHLAESETLKCAQRTIFKGLDLNETDSVNCQIESDGQMLEIRDCTVWNFGQGDHSEDNDDCSKLEFSPSVRAPISDVEILPLVERFPNFRINFRKIGWRYMHYRMQIGEANQRCHKLEFATEPEPSLHVSFACKVFGPWAAGHEVEMLMDIGNSPSDIKGHARYIMKVASNAKQINPLESIPIGEWYVTVVVDISQKPYLRVYWPVVPDKYNVTKYNVQLTGEKPKPVDLASCPNGYCFVELFAGFSSRNVTVYVQPVHEDCIGSSCLSGSPAIFLEFSLPLHFIVLIAVVLALVFLIFVCSLYFFCCAPPREPVELLLLYDATTKEHTWVVRRLVKYLEEVCRVRCLEAEREIPPSETRDPDNWLKKALATVDAVLYVASPTPIMDVRYCENPHLVYRALELISERKACHTHNRPGRILVAVPKYCSVEDIPQSLLMAPRFQLAGDMSWMLWALYNQHCWMPPFTWLAKGYLHFCWCPGPISAYRTHGTLLEDALDEAESKKKSEERRPPTPTSEWTGLTSFPPRGDKIDNESVPEAHKWMFQKVLYDQQSEAPPPDEELGLVSSNNINLHELRL